MSKRRDAYVIFEYGKRRNIWEYSTGYGKGATDKIAYNHPAIFPEKLARDHIISWSNEGDIVLDPMMGSGTTGKMAKQLNRNFIGIEISPEYFEIAKKRIFNKKEDAEKFIGDEEQKKINRRRGRVVQFLI
jgi:DNA modification methylase